MVSAKEATHVTYLYASIGEWKDSSNPHQEPWSGLNLEQTMEWVDCPKKCQQFWTEPA
jgi:hypothetical protein